MNNTTYCKYLKELIGEDTCNTLTRNVSRNTNNNLVNLDEGEFRKELKKLYPSGYESLEEDIITLINKKKGIRKQ